MRSRTALVQSLAHVLGPARALALACAAAACPVATAAPQQASSPVYVDDSPRAADVLGQLGGLAERGNTAEAVRALQALLETEGDRLVAQRTDPSLYRNVRSLTHEALLASPDMLARYRQTSGPLAARLLAEGNTARVERELLLTEAGFDAALQIAGERFARADFDAARLALLQLEAHPDRLGARADRAAALLAEVARFRGSEDDLAVARAWSPSVPGDLDAVAPPTSALQRGYALFEPMPPLADDEPLESPLRSAPFGDDSASPIRLGENERPWILPTVAGPYLLINDGERIECFDTATLDRAWIFETDADQETAQRARRSRGRSQAVEDTMTVTAGGGVAVAALGETFNNRRYGDARLHAIELATGRRLWSAGPAALDTELAGAMVHGPVVIVGDTVVAGLFTFAPLRRVHLCHMVGIDLYTGAPKWIRLVGTAGVMPSRRGQEGSPVMLADAGVVYRVSPLGVITAVEAATGRIVWSRLVPSQSEALAAERRVWMQDGPVMHGGTLLAAEPSRTALLAINAATGRLTGERPIMDLGWPDYMLRVADRIVFVTADAFRVTSVEGVLTDEPDRIDRAGPERSGRAVVAGGVLVEPTRRGVRIIDPARSTAAHSRLEFPGTPAIADGQLLVLGPTKVHGYLDWLSARTVLAARIAQDPSDATPAIALAELAFRAGATDAIAPAASHALDAAARSGDEASRDRLYDALLDMLASDTVKQAAERGDIVASLDRAAVRPTQRVGVAMQRGLWHRDGARPGEAASAFQTVLADPALAASQYKTKWRLERGDRAATAALAALVEAEGAGVYGEFAAEARAELERITATPGTPGAAIEAVARRYPIAPAAPELWLLAADAYLAAGEARRSQSALRNGFDAAGRASALGSPTAHELAGRLVAALADADQLYPALQVIRRAEKLTRNGAAIDAAALERELTARLSERTRPPRPGETPLRMAQLLGGWEPVMPLSDRGPRSTSHVLMRSERQGVLALWSAGEEAGPGVGIAWEDTVLASPDAPTGLVPVWTRPLGDSASSEPIVVGLSPTAALLYHGMHEAARFEAIDTITGRTMWASPVFGQLFEGKPSRYDTGVLETPLDGQVWLRDHLVVVSAEHVGLVERFGRAAIFDRDTGALVLAQQLDVPMVYEAAMQEGVLAVIGERPGDPDKNEGDGVVPMAAAYDIARNTAIYGPAEFRDRRSFGRWVRLADDRTMLLGLDKGVVGVDLSRGEQVWTVDDPGVRLSGDCIVGRERAYIVGVDRQLWQIDLGTGRLRTEPLEDLGRVSQATEIETRIRPGGGLVFASDVGLAVFDADGRLVGGDAYDGSVPFVRPVIADGLVLAVADRAEPATRNNASKRSFRYAAMQLPDGTIRAERSLELHGTPRSLAALDGFVIIGLDDAAAVYEAPPPEDDRP
ncbi:MAG: PQQ-binding-like beta-propeller repeat protein [Planctomycetota bacterium]